MTLIESKWIDTGIFEPYVAFKVEPIIRDQGINISADLAVSSHKNLSPSSIRNRLIEYGRNIALVEAISIFRGIKRANLTEDTDITFLDAYLLSYAIMLHHSHRNEGLGVAANSEWKNKFAKDISYLVFCPGDDLKHGQSFGWDFYRNIRATGNDPSPEFYITLFLEIRRRRTNGNKKPYSNPISPDEGMTSGSFGLYLPEEIFSVDLNKTHEWSKLAQTATNLFATSGIDMWAKT